MFAQKSDLLLLFVKIHIIKGAKMNTVLQSEINFSTNDFPLKFKITAKSTDPNLQIIDIFAADAVPPEHSVGDMAKRVIAKYFPDKNDAPPIKTAGRPDSVKQMRLGDLFAFGAINRDLDEGHVACIVNNFDWSQAQNASVTHMTKRDGTEVFSVNNGQHTLAGITVRVMLGHEVGFDATNWEDYEVSVNLSDPKDPDEDPVYTAIRQHRSVNNNSKSQTTYDDYQNAVFGAKTTKTKLTKRESEHHASYEMCKEFECYIVPPKGKDIDKPGAVPHWAEAIGKLKEEKIPEDKNKYARYTLANHKEYWPNFPVDTECFAFYPSLLKACEKDGIDTTTPQFGKCMIDFHALIQTLFGDMKTLKTDSTKAYKKLCKISLEPSPHVPANVSLAVVNAIYKKLGGTFELPSMDAVYVRQNGLTLLNCLHGALLFEINKKLLENNKKLQKNSEEIKEALLPAPKKATVTKIKKPSAAKIKKMLTVVNG